MEFAQSCIRVLAAVALFAMGVHFAPVQASVANDRGSLSAAFDGAHRSSVVALAKQTSVGKFGLAEQDCPPVCPTGCPHSPAADCCGSGVLAVSSVVIAVISAAGSLPCEADRGLSGVEPDALQEPPQLFA
jgi:hypothetical protein